MTKGVVLAGLSNAKGLTWSALDGAFMAFWDYMQHRGYGLGQFRIYYGLQFVGKGALRENRT